MPVARDRNCAGTPVWASAALAIALTAAAACVRTAPQEAEVEQGVPVIAEPVRLGTIRATISATGVVSTLPGATFTVVASQAGRIADIMKTVGDSVRSGEVLVRFEYPSLTAQAAVNTAAAKAAGSKLQQSRVAQARVRGLLSSGAASQREMDDADREVTIAEAELAVAQAAMTSTEAAGQNTLILAPFNGTVTARLHEVGDLVRPEDTDPILQLIDPRQVQLTATVPVADLTRFTVGATARAIAAIRPIDAFRVERQPTSELLRVASRPEPDAGATTVAVTLAFDSPTELAPGTQVGIEIDGEQRLNVPLVPAIAVLREPGSGPVVVVAAGSIAQRRAVVTGLEDSEFIEIRSGLKAGELIVTQGHSSLREGTPITVTAP